MIIFILLKKLNNFLNLFCFFITYFFKMELLRLEEDLKYVNQIGRTLNIEERFNIFYYYYHYY